MLEHVRSTRIWKARLQDLLQPAWTTVTGGCHPNRDTERAVEASGFQIEDGGRRAKADMRRFAARPAPGTTGLGTTGPAPGFSAKRAPQC